MAVLFFLMAFVNTIVDNLKDTLIVTLAVGGSADVIAFLNVWAVLPSSLLFLAVFNRLSAFLSREQLFNSIICGFLAFMTIFAFVLYPNHGALHPHAAAERWLQVLPAGAAGAVCMIRNWTFSLFFCMSELWGDVGLSLLFWGLANETTSLKDAPLLYPLFGIGANVAQVFAGQCLKHLGSQASTAASFSTSMHSLCMLVLAFGTAILALHKYITHTHKSVRTAPSPAQLSAVDPSEDAARNGVATASGLRAHRPADAGGGESGTLLSSRVNGKAAAPPSAAALRTSVGFGDALRYCWTSPTIRCLALMAVAQGVCTNLLEYTWQKHLHLYRPDPVQYTAFKGDVASVTGVITVGMMAVAPTCFKTLGWRRTARTTPELLLFVGVPFFAACILFHALASYFALSPAVTMAYLGGLSVVGAVLYVSVRAAKFSLFKPAEEMVYLSLDERARLNGKAAVDVLGAQFGKSCGSSLQQLLFLLTSSATFLQLPLMGAMFACIAWSWGKSVDTLAHLVPPHTSLQSVDFDSEDESFCEPECPEDDAQRAHATDVTLA